VDDQN